MDLFHPQASRSSGKKYHLMSKENVSCSVWNMTAGYRAAQAGDKYPVYLPYHHEMSTTARPLSRWGTEAHRPSAQEPALKPTIQQPGMVPARPEGASSVADGHAEVSSSYQDAPWRPLTLSSCVHTAQTPKFQDTLILVANM